MATRGVNKVILIGNVGNDPDIRTMPNGNSVAALSIATSETWKDKNSGQQQEKTEWHKVVFFNRLAEIVDQYVAKGTKLYIEGRLQTRSWEQDGVKRYTTEIIGSEMQMLDSRAQNEQNYARENPDGDGTASSPQQSPASFDNFDDDIPF